MDVFVAVQRGVYRHDIVGAFTTLDRAKAAGEAAITAEPDHYHDVEIVLRQLNEQGPEVRVGTLRPRRGATIYATEQPWQKTAELLGIDWAEGDE